MDFYKGKGSSLTASKINQVNHWDAYVIIGCKYDPLLTMMSSIAVSLFTFTLEIWLSGLLNICVGRFTNSDIGWLCRPTDFTKFGFYLGTRI